MIEQPIQPTGTDFTAMLALRDAARAAMLKHVGEPDLGATWRSRRRRRLKPTYQSC